MEDFYRFIENKNWDCVLTKTKSEQASLRRNTIEWKRICAILQDEFIKYATNERPVLVSTLCFEYIKLKISGYIYLTDEATLAIENIGIEAFSVQNSTLLNSFAEICQFSPLAKAAMQDNKKTKIKNDSKAKGENRTKPPRLDWLTPLFKSSLETHFYQALKDVFPSYFIYPNVALSNIFEKDLIFPSLTSAQQDFYFKGVVDFVVYDPAEAHTPKYFFEVDSFYHDRQEAIIRDEKKNAIFNAANIELYRIRPNSDSLTTKHDFVSEINSLIRKTNIQ